MIQRMRYPGGKGKSFQQIINLLPPHCAYIESHLGGGAVMRHKLPTQRNIGIDKDERVIAAWRNQYPNVCELFHGDACTYLHQYPFKGGELVYCDPPYHPSTRLRKKIYRHDYTTEDHEALLATLKALPCMVVVSGYASTLYESALRDWNRVDFSAKTHTGIRTESLWFNFEKPKVLQDPRYMGSSFREREIIKRRQQRLRSRIELLPAVERHALIDWMLRRDNTLSGAE